MLGKVIKGFTDKLNQTIIHEVDGIYHTEDAERFEEVTSDKNAIGEPIVKQLTLTELKALADKHEIEYPAKLKRDDLEVLIEGELYGRDA